MSTVVQGWFAGLPFLPGTSTQAGERTRLSEAGWADHPPISGQGLVPG